MRQRRLESGGPGSTGLISRAQQPVGPGPRRSEQPRKVDEPAEVVVSAVTDGDAVQAVTAGPCEIRAGVSAGNTYIELSTVDSSSRQPVERVVALNAAMPAAVSGSVPAVENGIPAMMVGGDTDAYLLLEPMLPTRAPLVQEPPEHARSDVEAVHKDLRLAGHTPRPANVPLPSTAVADEMLGTARAPGHRHRDTAALFLVLSDLAGAPGDANYGVAAG